MPAAKAGLTASLLSCSQQLGGALGLAVLSAVATTRSGALSLARPGGPARLDSGYHWALLVAALLLAGAALVARGINKTHTAPPLVLVDPDPICRGDTLALR